MVTMWIAGGMSEEESTLNLQALQDEVKRLGVNTPWRLTFSYGRALQSATLKVQIQQSYLHRDYTHLSQELFTHSELATNLAGTDLQCCC